MVIVVKGIVSVELLVRILHLDIQFRDRAELSFDELSKAKPDRLSLKSRMAVLVPTSGRVSLRAEKHRHWWHLIGYDTD